MYRRYQGGGMIDALSTLAPLADLAVPGLGTAVGVGLQLTQRMFEPQSIAPGMIKDNNPYSYATGGKLRDKQLSSDSTLIQGNPHITDGNPRIVNGRRVRLDHNEIVSRNTIKGDYALSPNLVNPKTGNKLAEDGKKIKRAQGRAEKYLNEYPEDNFAMNTRQFADYLYNKLVLENERQLQENPDLKHVQQTQYQAGGSLVPEYPNVINKGDTGLFDQYTNLGVGDSGVMGFIPQSQLMGDPYENPVSAPTYGIQSPGVPPTYPPRPVDPNDPYGRAIPKGSVNTDPEGYGQDLFKGINPFLPITKTEFMPGTAPMAKNKYIMNGVGSLEDITQTGTGSYIPSNFRTVDVNTKEGTTPTTSPTSTSTPTSASTLKVRGVRTRKGAKYPNKIRILNKSRLATGNNLPDLVDVKDFQSWVANKVGDKKALGKAGVDGKYGKMTKAAWEKYGQAYLDRKYGTPIAPLATLNPTAIGQAVPTNAPIATQSSPQGQGSNAMGYLGNIGDVLQSMAALSRFSGLDLEKTRFPREPLVQENVDRYLQDVNRLSRASRNLGRSYASQMGYNQGIYADALNQANRIRGAVNARNNQYLAQNNRVNTQIANQEIIANEQNRAAQDAAKQNAFAQLGILGQAFNNKRSAQEALDYLAEAYPDVYDYLIKGVKERQSKRSKK